MSHNCCIPVTGWPLLGALIAAVWATEAFGAGLDPFAGSWRGGGSLILTDGSRERVRCRSSLKVSDGGAAGDQSLKCTSTGHGVFVKSTLRANGTRLQGTWTAAGRENDTTGTLNGALAPDRMALTLKSGDIQASLTIALKNCKQTVVITGKLGTLSKLTVELNKKC